MGDYELYTPWLKQKFDRHPRATVATLAIPPAILTYVGVYKGIECLKDHVTERQVTSVLEMPFQRSR